MRCPYCSQTRDKVIDSRASEGGAAIRRRRQCLACDKRFTTFEHVERNLRLTVIKKGGSRVPYDHEKLLRGVEVACYKRPVPAEAQMALVDAVEEELIKRGDKEIESFDIGRLVSDKLKSLDQVAYVRFASVYKQFRDIEDLLAEVRDVIDSRDPAQGPDQAKLF